MRKIHLRVGSKLFDSFVTEIFFDNTLGAKHHFRDCSRFSKSFGWYMYVLFLVNSVRFLFHRSEIHFYRWKNFTSTFENGSKKIKRVSKIIFSKFSIVDFWFPSIEVTFKKWHSHTHCDEAARSTLVCFSSYPLIVSSPLTCSNSTSYILGEIILTC